MSDVDKPSRLREAAVYAAFIVVLFGLTSAAMVWGEGWSLHQLLTNTVLIVITAPIVIVYQRWRRRRRTLGKPVRIDRDRVGSL